jgi:hypothetical protein
LVYLSLKLNQISKESLEKLFPNCFHNKLKTLLIKIIIENSNNWLLNDKKAICKLLIIVINNILIIIEIIELK